MASLVAEGWATVIWLFISASIILPHTFSITQPSKAARIDGPTSTTGVSVDSDREPSEQRCQVPCVLL